MTGRKEDEEVQTEAAEQPQEDELQKYKELSEKYLDMARRLQADFDNYRKRADRDKEEYKKYACSSIVQDLLTVVDDLDRALGSTDEDSILVQGVRGVRTNLMKVLSSNGLEEMPSEGKFDPNMHEALCMVDGDEDGMIAEVFQKGYTINGKPVRYSKVKVTRKANKEPETQKEEAPEAPVADEAEVDQSKE